MTEDRGSYIRVFTADFDQDGRPEVVAPNKGAQNPDRNTTEKNPISWFDVTADPLSGSWVEHELTRVIWPINSQTVDLDGDGDMDVVGGSTGERRILWFENRSSAAEITFAEHRIDIEGTTVAEGAPRPPNASQTGRSGQRLQHGLRRSEWRRPPRSVDGGVRRPAGLARAAGDGRSTLEAEAHRHLESRQSGRFRQRRQSTAMATSTS